MSITITIPAELEPLMLKQANVSGKAVEDYALDLLKKGVELADPWELLPMYASKSKQRERRKRS